MPAATADRAQRLYVVALDDHSQPVTDLTEADFRVVDRGKAQQILSFAGFSARRQVTVILLDMLNEALPLQEMGRQGIIRALQGLESADRLYLYLLTNGGELFPVQPLEAGATPALPAERPWTLDIQPLLQAAIRKV